MSNMMSIGYTWKDVNHHGFRDHLQSPVFGFEKAKFRMDLVYGELFDEDEDGLINFNLFLTMMLDDDGEDGIGQVKSLDVQVKIPFQIDSELKLVPGIRSLIWELGEYGDIYTGITIEIKFDRDALRPPVDHLKVLTTDLANLRLDGGSLFTDITFLVDGREFAAHKNILAVRSPVLKAMFGFGGRAVENQQNRVVVDDIEADVFEALLDYVYTGKVKDLETMAPELLTAANKYDIAPLVQECTNFMLDSITTESVCRFLFVADLHDLVQLKSKCIDFVNANTEQVMDHQDWVKLIESNPSLIAQCALK